MATQLCSLMLQELSQLVHLHGTFMVIMTVSNFFFALVATIGNLLVITAIWKASSMLPNIKKLLLNLALSDLAVGSLAQLMFGIIIAIISRKAVEGASIDFLCPTILTVCYFVLNLLGVVSFLTVTAMAVDRLLAISLHLRYQELVTPRRVELSLVILWLISGGVAGIFITTSIRNRLANVIVEIGGLLCTTVAYIRIYSVSRYHRNQIHSQQRLSRGTGREVLRRNKLCHNAIFLYVVFMACYLPFLCSSVLSLINTPGVFPLLAHNISVFIALLNSSLNPIVCLSRYGEIRENLKRTMKRIFLVKTT